MIQDDAIPKEILVETQLTHKLQSSSDAIVALCTPRGSGAVAMVRISGDDACRVADSIAHIPGKQSLSTAPSHTIHYGFVIDTDRNERVDEVMFNLMRAPRTFTGLDTVEITCHNNDLIIDKIIARAVAAGARQAERGEFTRQALLAGRIDLAQAEAVNDLIAAQSEQAVSAALGQVQGSLSQVLNQLEEDLVKILTFTEASFEFGEEEQDDVGYAHEVRTLFDHVQEKVATLLAAAHTQSALQAGARVACIGSVNAGKSTLFNALVGSERAIVSDHAGTTRDTIECGMRRDGISWTLIDTAGIRCAEHEVEIIGIERSRDEAKKADLILLIVDQSMPIGDDEKAFYSELIEQSASSIMLIATKTDKPEDATTVSFLKALEQHVLNHQKVAARSGVGVEQVHAMITQTLLKKTAGATPYLLNERHVNLVRHIAASLERAQRHLYPDVAYELLAVDVRVILESVTQLTGHGIGEKLLDTVFSTFCVGK
jgi:tRNA modification GTPase